MAQRPGHPAARHPRGSGGKEPGGRGGGRCAVTAAGQGRGPGLRGRVGPGRAGSGRVGPGRAALSRVLKAKMKTRAGQGPCRRAAAAPLCLGAPLALRWARRRLGGADPAEGAGRQPALTGSLPGRALSGAPLSPLPPPHLLLASVHKLAALPRGAPRRPGDPLPRPPPLVGEGRGVGGGGRGGRRRARRGAGPGVLVARQRE